MSGRAARVVRETKETRVVVEVALGSAAPARAKTGLGFFDHMLEALGHHGRLGLTVEAAGDLHVDEHHTVEDTALTVGQAIDQALGDRAGIARFGDAHAPLDEALARAVVDLSGRPFAHVDLGLRHPRQGEVLSENLAHFWRSLAMAAKMSLHLDVLRGENDHHRAESAFKAAALALRRACAEDGAGVPSTKGVL
jgi:imidazoleglycerol-phosphate dehydratase